MEMLEFVLLLLAAVLVSAVLDQVTPRVSLPLVQIALGAVIILLVGAPVDVAIDPELFLVLFIAPLLFDESRHASKRGLWDNKGAIVSLAVGLVLATVLVVGFVLNWLEPSIPLAAAFALGAALGPTDAVAVSALGKDIHLSSRQKSLLSGEALINDASGVVSFQFAIAAAITGSFSLANAAQSFAISFFGGIAVGLVVGLLAVLALGAIRSYGYESITVHVVFEVFTPFITFLAAEHFGTSGILAVVAAGLLIALMPHKPTPAAARAIAHRVEQRVGGARVRHQRRGVRHAGHAAAEGGHAVVAQQRDQLASAVRLGAARHGAGGRCAFPMGAYHGAHASRLQAAHRRSADTRCPGHHAFGPEGRHHAVHHHDHPVHPFDGRGVPSARQLDLSGIGRHPVHAAVGELRGAAACAERAS